MRSKKTLSGIVLFAFLVGGFAPVGVGAEGNPRAKTQQKTAEQVKAEADAFAKNRAEAIARAPKRGETKTAEQLKTEADNQAKNRADAVARAPVREHAKPSTSSNDEILCVLAHPWDGTMIGCFALGGFVILGLVSWVLWLSAVLFNLAIPYTLNMASFIKDIPIVALGWATFRDLANLFFIFIILYIAISTIIGNEGYGIKKLLGKVIVGAVLINFSLFFTQAMIDVSNIFALQFYNKITQNDTAKAAAGDPKGDTSDKLDSGISATFVEALGLNAVWRLGEQDATKDGAVGLDPNKPPAALGLNSTNLLVASFGGTVLVLITSFIFFAATIMFLIRAVTLVFLMILSPLAFLGNVLPAIGKYTNKWWEKLFSNLLFAPAYMALLYLVISIIADPDKFKGVGGSKGSFIGVFGGDRNMIGVAMTFVVLNMMMFACILIANQFGVAGGKFASSTVKSFAGGLGGFVGRNTLGAGADRLLQSNFIKKYAPNTAMRGLDSVRSAKYGSGMSFVDSRKIQDDKLKKAYDLSAEVRQRSGESDDAFRSRKKSAQAAAYKKLGVNADSSTGLPTLDSSGELESTTAGVLVKNAKLSSSQRAILGNKDINEEGIQKKLAEEVYDTENSAYKKAHKMLRAKVIEQAKAVKEGRTYDAMRHQLEAQVLKRNTRDRKHDLEKAKYNAGERDKDPMQPNGYRPAP